MDSITTRATCQCRSQVAISTNCAVVVPCRKSYARGYAVRRNRLQGVDPSAMSTLHLILPLHNAGAVVRRTGDEITVSGM